MHSSSSSSVRRIRRILFGRQVFWGLIFFMVQACWARKCYYSILGVPKTANEKEIQRAYRKLALKHHPDKGGDEEKFKELSTAYECLSDSGKRQVYDTYGEAGLENNVGGFPGGSTTGGFTNAGGGESPFHSFFSSGANPGSTGGFRTETFSFGSGNGGNIDISQILREMMGGFDGGGGSGGTQSFFSQGPPRSGTATGGGGGGWGGVPPRSAGFSPQPYHQRIKCTLEDLATGRTKKLKVSFQHGQEKIFEVALKPGWKAGTKITYPASADFPASMVFEVEEVPHAYFRREGNDLYYTCWIDPSQTNGGIKVKVPLPTGEVWSKHFPKDKQKEVLPPGKQLRISSKGMPIKGGPERGDLIIQFRIRRSPPSSSSSSR